jgi:hypothetical protein
MFLDNFYRIMPVTYLARPESKWDDDGLFHTYGDRNHQQELRPLGS